MDLSGLKRSVTRATKSPNGVGARLHADQQLSPCSPRHRPMLYDSDRPSAVMRFKTLHASRDSATRPAGVRERSDPPMIDLLRIPLKWNTNSADRERGFRRRGTLVGAKRRVSVSLLPSRSSRAVDILLALSCLAERASTLIACQLPVTDWHGVSGSPPPARPGPPL